MEFAFKSYKIIKTKSYIKKNSLFFMLDGVYRSSTNWVVVEQSLKTVCFSYWKICNKTVKKTLSSSIARTIQPIINGITFFMDSYCKWTSKQALAICFEALLFKVLAIQLNYKCYQVAQLKNNYSFQYKGNKALIFQFRVVNLKKKSK